MSAAVLLTRPEGDNGALARALERAGTRVLVAPLLKETLLDFETGDFSRFSGLVVTSKRAAAALGRLAVPERAQSLPVFAVGEATAQAARDIGFTDLRIGEATGVSLARLIAATWTGGTLLYLAGRDRSPDLEAGLDAAGIGYELRVVYAMDQAVELPQDVASALPGNGVAGAAFYSRRTAEAFVALTRAEAFDRMRRALVCLCISEACAAPLADAGFAERRIADRPDGEATDRLVAAFAAEL